MPNRVSSSPRRILALVLSAAVSFLSVEPAVAQVRAIAVESSGASAGQAVLAGARVSAPSGLSASSGFGLANLAPALTVAPSFAGAPALTAAPTLAAASLPAPAAAAAFAAQAPQAAPLAALAASELIANPENSPSSTKVGAVQATRAAPSVFVPTLADAPVETLREASGRMFEGLGISANAANLNPVRGARRIVESLILPFRKESRAAAASTSIERNTADSPSSPSAVPSFASPRVRLALLAAAVLGPFSLMAHASGFKAVLDSGDGLAWSTGIPLAAVVLFGLGRYAYLRYKGRSPAYPADGAVTPHHPRMPDAMHLLRNLTFGVLSGAAVTFATDPSVRSFNHIMNAQGHLGILHWLGITGAANVVAYFVLTDFIGYFNHWAFHRVPFLWRFHKVHHTDTDFDFSTYFRTHFGEDLLGVLPGAIITLLLGPTMLAILINSVFGNLWSQYQHMNVRLPRRAEAVLSRVIMTSEKHYIHHSMHIEQTNSNYASVFSFWDKLFGTYRPDDPNTVTAGLENYQDPSKLKFWDLVMMPFRSEKKP